MTQSPREATITRETRETRIAVTLRIDGRGAVDATTGLGFFDHMLTALAFHARFDLTLRCDGDLEVDDHHSIEDVALALGAALDSALGDRAHIARFAHAFAPLDEALARAVVDLSGRPAPLIQLGLVRPNIGAVACENLTHFFESFATAGRMALHLDVLRGRNDHHRAEAAFKACALALRQAVARDGRAGSAGEHDGDGAAAVPSTKGVL